MEDLPNDRTYIHVPAESLDAYRQAVGWNQFPNILPIEPPIVTGLDNVHVSWVQNFSATGYVWTLYLDEAHTQRYMTLTFDANGHLISIDIANNNNAPAKLIQKFTKGDKTGEAKPQLKAAYVEETIYVGKQNLEFLSTIKSKNELIADLVALLQSPAKNVISALQSAPNTIHGVLKALEEKAQ